MNRMDPTKPRCRGDLDVRTMPDGTTIVTHDGTVHLALDPSEYGLLRSLDGSRSVDHETGLDDAALVYEFAHAGLLEGTVPAVSESLTVTRVGVEFSGLAAVVSSIHRLCGRALFSAVGAMAVVVVIAVGLAVGIGATTGGSTSPTRGSGPSILLVLITSSFGASVIHETAHALVLHHHDRKVGRAGFGFYWGELTFFVDATDALLLPKRARILQTLAGPIADGTLAGLASLAALVVPGGGSIRSLLLLIAVRLWIDVVVNLCPILELDGYWVLSDLLDPPQLREESRLAAILVCRGQLGAGNLGLAVYGIVSVIIGVGAVVLSLFIWVTVYCDIMADAWSLGFLGKSAAVLFVGPFLAGIGASLWGAVSASLRR